MVTILRDKLQINSKMGVSDLCLLSFNCRWMERSSRDSTPRGGQSSDIPSDQRGDSNDIPSNRGAEINEEPPPKWAEKQFRSREYQRKYYHTLSKRPVERELCKKINSSISAMRRHRRKNMRSQLLQFEQSLNSKATSRIL